MIAFDNFDEELYFVIQWKYSQFAFQAFAWVFASDGFGDLVEHHNRMECHNMPKNVNFRETKYVMQ